VADPGVAPVPVDDGGTPTPAPAPTPTFCVVDVVRVEVALPSQFPVVELRQADPPYRELSVPVGMPEGVALAYALEQMVTPRPLTHELFATVLARLTADVVAVRVTGRRQGTYLAEIDLMGPRGRVVVDCRPSDGFVLAYRQAVPAPVLADERLFAGDGEVEPPPADG